MLFLIIVVLAVILCLHHAAEASLQLVGSDGRFVTGYQLARQVPASTDRVLNVLDCTFDSKCDFVNEALGTRFNSRDGLSVDISNNAAIQYSSSDLFTPAQVSTLVEYYISLSGKLILLFDATQIESALEGHERVLRKLVALSYKRLEKSQKTEINVVCVGHSTDPAYVEDTITKRFESLWLELAAKSTFRESVALKVLTVDASAPLAIKSALEAGSFENSQLFNTADLMANTWNVAAQSTTIVSSKEHQQAVAAVETVYLRNLIKSNSILNQWQSRVSSGRQVADFGRRVKDLMQSVQWDFQQATSGGIAVKERVERLKALNVHLVDSISRLQMMQLSNMISEVEDKCRRELLKLLLFPLQEETKDGVQKQQEEVEKLIRRLLFDFKTRCDAMTNDWLLSTVSEDHFARLAASLEQIVTEYPESSEVKLAVQEREVRRAKSASSSSITAVGKQGKKKLSVRIKGLVQALLSGVSLSLVGMLRPPGHGNLQAVISTASQALWGIPVNYLLGVHNDGESMEVMGDDREYPLIRLQPKINFNLDV